MTKILMVCMGNICRSPMAQVVGERMAQAVGQGGASARPPRFASAGTHAHHIGEPPDPRATATLARRGYRHGKMRSRRITTQDFEQFDLILAMDSGNLQALAKQCPPQHQHKLRRLLDYVDGLADKDVPDPYYGNEAGFERVLDLCETGVRALLNRLHEPVCP